MFRNLKIQTVYFQRSCGLARGSLVRLIILASDSVIRVSDTADRLLLRRRDDNNKRHDADVFDCRLLGGDAICVGAEGRRQ